MSGRSSNRTPGARTRRGPAKENGLARVGIHRIDQQVGAAGLDQKRGVSDERDYGLAECGRRGTSRLGGDFGRPADAGGQQQTRQRSERLAVGAAGIEETVAVEMIAEGRHQAEAPLNAAANSAAVANRSPGSRASARRIAASTCSGTSTTGRSFCGGPVKRRVIVACGVGP